MLAIFSLSFLDFLKERMTLILIAGMAQLVEHLSCKQKVPGSSPVTSFFI